MCHSILQIDLSVWFFRSFPIIQIAENPKIRKSFKSYNDLILQ